jgi:tetratricopeptide (TPR) repeat protein
VRVNNSNSVAAEGEVSRDRNRPEVSRQLSSDLRHVEGDKNWKKHNCHHSNHHDRHDSHCNFYFSWAWSPFSCGNVAYFPYSYSHSWCDYPVGYYGLSYYYPGYHRRFIFVSLGGYWPVGYHYSRYYWYGCHPYYWYGPTLVDPYPAVEEYNTYNTYNYYGDASTTEGMGWRYPFGDENYDASDYIKKSSPVDKPESETAADQSFARAVDLFAAGNYEGAAGQLREAVKQSPEDVVLPFTYAQALFANGDYSLAAGVLRVAVAQIPEDELTIYYPRGLYADEKVLSEQIAALETAISAEPFSTDYHLLLGYQYMGTGDLNKARGALFEAAKNQANQPTVGKLLQLTDKLEQEKEPQS